MTSDPYVVYVANSRTRRGFAGLRILGYLLLALFVMPLRKAGEWAEEWEAEFKWRADIWGRKLDLTKAPRDAEKRGDERERS